MNKFYSFLLLFLMSCIGLTQKAIAQCDASCAPGNATENTISFLQSGFFRIEINNATNVFSPGRAVAGYQNLFCSSNVSVFRGASLRVSVTVGPNVNERINVYIDLNNDNTIDPTSELMLSLNARGTVTGFITMPSTVPVDTKIRMRFISDRSTATLSPCMTPAIGQGVDIGITPRINSQPPIANFTADSITCSRTIAFEDLSLNAPSTYLWEFGDGNTSTLPNPVHTYDSNGVYTVSLRVENANGVNIRVKNNFIRINDTTAIPALCQPIVANPCCGYRIANMVLANINTTGYPATGVNDLACRFKANLLVNTSYTIRFNGSPTAAQDSKLYIDLNNDGDFNNTNELIAYVSNQTEPLIRFRLPANTPINVPIRARLLTDFVNSSFTACADLTHGASIDFTILPKVITTPPTASFARIVGNSCTGNFQFAYNGLFSPDTLFWNFGDGNSQIVTNSDTVQYTYSSFGNYNVTLIAANAFGRDTAELVNSASFSGFVPAFFCEPRAFNLNAQDGITRVQMGTFDFSSLLSVAEGFYVDRTCTNPIIINRAATNPTLTVSYPPNRNSTIRVWIDWNRDGNITPSEMMVDLRNQNSGTSAALINIPANATNNEAYRVRIIQAVAAVPNFCSNITTGQCEDYSLVLLPQPQVPQASMGNLSISTCNNTVQLFDSSLNSPTSWNWEIIGVGRSTNRNPVFNNLNPGTYTVRLIVRNAIGADTVERNNAITIVPANGLVAPACLPQIFFPSPEMGITQVSFLNTLSNSNTSPSIYTDNSCRFINPIQRNASFNLVLRQNPNNTGFLTAYADWNGNGIFESSEALFPPESEIVSTRAITVPNTARTGRLRLRIVVYDSPVPGPCETSSFGEVEDYSLDIAPPTQRPIANFNFRTVNCSRTVSFTDNSSNSPDAFLWSFGNGTTSTQQNPSFTYASPGIYEVRLIVSNGIGADTLIRNVSINGLANMAVPECEPQSTNANASFPFGINRVQFGTLDYSSPLAWEEGYLNRTCTDSTRLRVDLPHNLTVTTSNTDTEIVDVWIDLNGDGFLTQSEKIFQSVNLLTHTFVYTAPANVLRNTPLRMRVRSDLFQGNIATTSCDNSFFGQIEDYSVIFTEPGGSAVPSVQNIKVSPNPVRNKLSIRLPDTHALKLLKVMDVTGKVLNQIAINPTQTAFEMEMIYLQPGLYFLHFEGENAPESIRIIKE